MTMIMTMTMAMNMKKEDYDDDDDTFFGFHLEAFKRSKLSSWKLPRHWTDI
jgi:hypothetical protein